MKDLKRREFLKGAGAAVTLAAINPALNATIINSSKKILTATHYGAFYSIVKDGKLVRVAPFEKDRNPGEMINAIPDRVYSPTRVKYPYVREGFLKDGHKSDTSKRGKEKFIRVSWEKAYELVAKEFKRVHKDHGPDSVYGGCYGWWECGNMHMIRNVSHRMLKLTGGFVDDVNTYSTGAIRVIMPYVTGSASAYYKPSAWHTVVKNVDNLVIIGADPYITNKIAWTSAEHSFYSYMDELKKEAKKREINIININPIYTETAQKLNAKQISLKPGTDVALLLGIANYMYKNNLHDEKFMKKYTFGRKEFFAYLIGKEDGIDKTPSWAEKITGISEKEIIALAKLFSKGKTTLMGGWAIQRMDSGEQSHWMITTLAAMIGQIGQAGGGYTYSGHYSNLGASAASAPGLGALPNSFKETKDIPWVTRKSKYIPVSKISDMLLNPGKAFKYNGKDLTYPDIKMIYWAGGNPFHHHQDVNKLIKAWEKPETIVFADPYWTASARMADIVLPTTTSLERNDITFYGHGSHESIIAMKKAVEPLAESKNDYDICTGILSKLGLDKYYTEGKNEMDWIQEFYKGSMKQAKSKNIAMPSFEEFWEKGHVDFEITEKAKNFVSYKSFIDDKRANRLGTPSGKIEIYSKTIEAYNYSDCKPHPTWYEPIEYLGSKKAEKYPFHIVSPHPKYRLHSQLNNTWLRNVYEVQGREPMLINPADAKAKGINDGDVVRVFNDRGSILAGAVVTDTIRKNVVSISEGSWYDPADFANGDTTCVHGHVNVLTIDKGTSSLAQGNIAHTALVDFEKFEGELPPIKVFSAPQRG
ncbi:MAG: trimethylamine-N-oxide reductase TorA [Halarcobacter sp.]